MKYTDKPQYCTVCGTRCDTARLTQFANALGKPVCWHCSHDEEPDDAATEMAR